MIHVVPRAEMTVTDDYDFGGINVCPASIILLWPGDMGKGRLPRNPMNNLFWLGDVKTGNTL